ncbi:MAG: hypothetical protein GC202_00130 [Alphaproteobacteria bacterium]|nr:hypothetical protein [Alphaproteobacteria bacterium]
MNPGPLACLVCAAILTAGCVDLSTRCRPSRDPAFPFGDYSCWPRDTYGTGFGREQDRSRRSDDGHGIQLKQITKAIRDAKRRILRNF